jgi:hypothetical protein
MRMRRERQTKRGDPMTQLRGGLLAASSLALICAYGTAAAAAERVASVPGPFQGEWMADLKGCGSKSDDSRLEIGADRIRFYESSGPIRAVVVQGDRELALIVELSGEGERWLSFSHFRLSEDGKSLTDVSSEPAFVRHRCAKGVR